MRPIKKRLTYSRARNILSFVAPREGGLEGNLGAGLKESGGHHDKGIQRSETEAEAAESEARSAEASGAEAEVEKVKNRRAT